MFRVYVMFPLPESTKIDLVVHRQFHMLINVSLKRSLGGTRNSCEDHTSPE